MAEMSNSKYATEIGVPTFEPEVSCGKWCIGGSVVMNPTVCPEYTEVGEVWVRGSDVETIRADAAAKERERIVALIRKRVGTIDDNWPVDDPYRMMLRIIERGEHNTEGTR